jgi:regulator of replication initiation timing
LVHEPVALSRGRVFPHRPPSIFFHFLFDGGVRNGEKKESMNIKRWQMWVGLALIFVSLGLLFHANMQRSDAQKDASDAHQQIDQLQAKLDELKSASVDTLKQENARLRAENQSYMQKLAKANGDLTSLATDKQTLTGQLQMARQALGLQQEHLQELTTENQHVTAVASTATAAATAANRNTCLENLRLIDAAKQVWALDNSKDLKDVPTAQDLASYLKGNAMPVCPSGGTYTIGAMDEAPSCSVHGRSPPLEPATAP